MRIDVVLLLVEKKWMERAEHSIEIDERMIWLVASVVNEHCSGDVVSEVWDPRSILACIAWGSPIFSNYSLSVDAVLCDNSPNTQRIYRGNWLHFSSIISTRVCVIAWYTG